MSNSLEERWAFKCASICGRGMTHSLLTLDKGYKKVILGMGGTNTVDCGIGMSQALGVNFYDKKKKIVIPQNKKYYAGIDLERIYNISGDDLSQIFKNTEIEVVCDADITIKQMYIPALFNFLFHSDNRLSLSRK